MDKFILHKDENNKILPDCFIYELQQLFEKYNISEVASISYLKDYAIEIKGLNGKGGIQIAYLSIQLEGIELAQ